MSKGVRIFLAPVLYQQQGLCAASFNHTFGQCTNCWRQWHLWQLGRSARPATFAMTLFGTSKSLAPVAFAAIGTLGAPRHLCYDFFWHLQIVGASGICVTWDARRAQTPLS